jgi:signal transduction histidine kinase
MDKKASGFKVDLRLLLELGERLISRDEVAVVELVKNAYDADASTVKVMMDRNKIEVKDNGEGMDLGDIVEGWLTIGTVMKKRKEKTTSGRRVLGEKGLGRLAVLRLGKLTTVYTQKKKAPCYKIVMDWEKARRKLETRTFTSMEEMVIGVSQVKENIFPKGHGTDVVIENLNISWEKNRIERLKIFLSRLVEPRADKETKFDIQFLTNGEVVKLEPPEVTTRPHYRLNVTVDSDGRFTGLIEWHIEKSEGTDKVEGRIKSWKTRDDETMSWKTASEGGCGKFSFRVNVWDLDVKELRGWKNDLRRWSGISLVRDSFRVVQPDVDWLGLDLRRVQNPTMRLSTNQVIGAVFISSDTNPSLVDKTDREGVLENESFSMLKETIYQLLDVLERKRYTLRREKGLSHGVIFNYLDTKPLKFIASALPSEKRKEIEEYAANLDKFRNMLEEWILGRDRMATMGMLGARLIHEARSALMKITDNYPLIEKYQDKFDSPLRERLTRMVTGGKMLARIFRELDPFLKFRGKRREDIVLKEVVTALEFLFGPELRKNDTKLENKIPRSIVFRANLTDAYVMLANFLDNATYWLKESKNERRIVEFRAQEENDSLTIEIADNGPGIDPENTDKIFEAGFTTKPGGTGLGLSILRDIVEFYGGKVEVSEDKKLKGALFRVILPLKKE